MITTDELEMFIDDLIGPVCETDNDECQKYLGGKDDTR